MRKSGLSILFLLILSFIEETVSAQVVINEVMASNSGVIVDPDYNESSDWIELYNKGTQTLSLKGYYLTDNFTDPTKWKIESNIELKSNEYLLIWADGLSSGLHTSFKLSASGEELALVSPALMIVDSILFGPQEPNISYGRKQDGNNEWVYFQTSTPGTANSTNSFNGIVKSVPNFSVTGGIYRSSQNVEIKTLFGGDVRYSLDGSEPDTRSMIADSPIAISKTTVVRARIYKPGQVLGPVVTHTYFIDPNNEIGNLPVISISSAPENFWDKTIGIYTVHSTKPDWEIPINIELFENDGSDRAAFNLPAGAKSTGLYSWQLPEKMLGISFRKEYGASKLEYPLIFEKQRKIYDTFTIRASGSDWGNALFRDGLIQTAAVYNTNLDNSGFRPCVVYINGQFMGIHNIREKIDEDYIVGNYGIEPGTFDMIEEVDGGINVEVGDDIANTHFVSLTSKDLTVQANYDAVAAEMDIDDFTDMVCTEVYSGNSSIGHNLMKWKPKDSGKWKWILMDFDRGFSGVNNELIDFYIRESGWPFRDLMKNEEYKKYFGRKLADLLFTTFNAERIIGEVDDHQQLIEAAIPAHILRWAGTSGTGNYSNIKGIPSVDYWLSEVEKVKAFALARPAVILSDLTNYGFQSHVAVSVSTLPANAGILTFNGLTVPVSNCVGAYPASEEIKLVAEAKPGYQFQGWASNQTNTIIDKEAAWKFSDTGTNLGTIWQSIGYDDSNWESGNAELGYGDGDENTIIDFGGNSEKKHITYYFRKEFDISDQSMILSLQMQIKVDDGAVVYLNGHEIHRVNLPEGIIDYQTTAINAIGGSDESSFKSYSVDPKFLQNGNNVIAVEVHQNSSSSSDISFDLEILAYTSGSTNLISTSKELILILDSEKDITAIFEKTEKCIIPSEIVDEVVLYKACSPYVTSGDVVISTTGKLIIEAGVEILMADGASIVARGPILATGTQNEPVRFRSNPDSFNKKWGVISFKNVQDTSVFSNVTIEDASFGPHPLQEIAAISLFHSNLKMDRMTIENVYGNPIVARYSDVTLTNSHLHSAITGDLINVKYGKAYIANCTFKGNDQPDTDAIDYDDVENGEIRNCRIYDFHGLNSDAIDIGEKAKNIIIDSIFVYNITDKGVSVGQQSSAHISNSVFTNCNLGAGLKDSCFVTIDHCTYYGTNIAVACYEKNVGDAGGNAVVTNSILSNSYDQSYQCDEFSTIDLRFSLSDNNRLPDSRNNILKDPAFVNPTFFELELANGSPCVDAGSEGDIGAGMSVPDVSPNLLISDIVYLTQEMVDIPEFIVLYNARQKAQNISGFKFTKGITFEFPEGTFIQPGKKVYLTADINSSFWNNRVSDLYQWTSGKLADEGEKIQLETDNGIVLDGVQYNNKAPWPEFNNALMAITLKSTNVDNHFGENWELKTIDEIVSIGKVPVDFKSIRVYPNPTSGNIYISGIDLAGQLVTVYNMAGNKVKTIRMDADQSVFHFDDLQQGMYLIWIGNFKQRLIVQK